MEKLKEIKIYQFQFEADWFLLNSTPKRKKALYEHETAAADLFVAYYPYMSGWSYEPPILQDRADRGMKIDGKLIYFEVDLCNEGIEKLDEKVDNYIEYSRTGERFHVVFVFVGEPEKVERRALRFLTILGEKRRGNQFLVASHETLISNPLGECLLSPKGQILSVQTLDSGII